MRSLAIFAILALAAPALAQDTREDAKRHFQNGEAFYRAGDYKSAIAEFKAADKLVPSPILAFNMGLCHEKLGEGAQAVTLYKAYLERRPDAPNRAQVEGRIQRLEAELSQKKSTPDLYQELEDTPPPGSGTVDTAPGASGVPETGTPPPGGMAPSAAGDPFVRRIPKRAPGVAGPAGPGPGPGPAAGGPEGPPPPPGGERAQAPGPGTGPSPQEPPPAPEKPAKKSKPVYKEWWFWVVVGVSAIILIDIATTDDQSATIQPFNNPSGATLFTF